MKNLPNLNVLQLKEMTVCLDKDEDRIYSAKGRYGSLNELKSSRNWNSSPVHNSSTLWNLSMVCLTEEVKLVIEWYYRISTSLSEYSAEYLIKCRTS